MYGDFWKEWCIVVIVTLIILSTLPIYLVLICMDHNPPIHPEVKLFLFNPKYLSIPGILIFLQQECRSITEWPDGMCLMGGMTGGRVLDGMGGVVCARWRPLLSISRLSALHSLLYFSLCNSFLILSCEALYFHLAIQDHFRHGIKNIPYKECSFLIHMCCCGHLVRFPNPHYFSWRICLVVDIIFQKC